ncbi:alkyl/aryl-sulfatase [Amycolatopsis sp. A1MSW2902]|uniref:alkyl/aryl-sulfatase n=1 Tax=Amycolatopsis sp. A1MSW2902 TaxID=687413 RepID=UPI00307E80F1
MYEPRASAATQARISQAHERYPFHDVQDFSDAQRGFVGTRADRQIRAADGRVVWDLGSYDFLDQQCSGTVNPSLWRQGQLVKIDGLFEVVEGVFQVRGFDLSTITFIEGDAGVIVLDPLISTETAAAALALYREHRGHRPVTAVIYSHSHVDHFGGVRGVVTHDDVASGVPIIAPAGFLAHAVAENIFAGPAMARRSAYMYGTLLDKGPTGQIGAGLGQTISTGTISLVSPTVDITHTGQNIVLDGVDFLFQLTPGTEAPSEMNFYLPDHKALCTAENTSHVMHNILTLRGAPVRDPHMWASYLTETIDLFGDDLDVLFASHHWPTWGREHAVEFLQQQRDTYAYLHDQTVRLLNQGHTGSEIAEILQMPPALEAQWHTRGYYGSLSHNVKAIYQRYMGWYDGNPAHLWTHPPVEAAQRYVELAGGADQLLAHARKAYAEGDYRWVAEVVNHLVFADPHNSEATALQADALEQLAFGAENATWRCAYLTGATELRNDNMSAPTNTVAPDLMSALTIEQIFDSVAIRVNGPRAWKAHLVLDWVIRDEDRTVRTELRNGVLIQRRPKTRDTEANATITLDRPTLIGLINGTVPLLDALGDNRITAHGDLTALAELAGYTDQPARTFEIVRP